MEQIKFIDKLEFDKTETEMVIQKLHNACNNLENLKDKNSDALIKDKLNFFIKDLNREIEYNEQILQELNESIEFEEQRIY